VKTTPAGLVVLAALAWPAASAAAGPQLDFLTGPSSASPEEVVRTYRPDVAQMKLVARAVSPDGITHLSYNQTLSGLESYDSGLDAHVTRDGRLITVNDTSVRGAKLRDTSPDVTALAGLGKARLVTGGLALPPKVTKSGRATSFATGEAANLRWIATDDGPRLAWDVTTEGEDGDLFGVVIDAETGDTLERASLTADAGLARYFRNDPDTVPNPLAQITMPPSWYDENAGGTRLWGQYARTYVDPNDQDPAPGAEAGGTRVQIPASSPATLDWLYDRSTTFPGATPCPPTGCSWNSADPATSATNRFQVSTNVHVLTSRYLEYLAKPPIGFDEASGNFQRVNTSGAGTGNDYVRAETNDGQGLNNANFATLPDGNAPRMQMFLFTTRDANGGDVAGIVYHEITHGLVCRLLINTSGGCAISVTDYQAQMMNEAWADYFSTDLLVGEGGMTDTAAPAELRMGAHVVPGGVRAKPLDCPVDPAGTTAACNGTQGAPVSGGYTYADIQGTANPPASGPHNGGEVWAETLWDLRTAVGRDAALRLIAGGLRMTPDNPSMLDARDAILRQALAIRSAPGAPDDYFATTWEVFRARGMGFDASTTGSSSTSPNESYAEPRNVLYSEPMTVTDSYPGGDNDGRFEGGELLHVSAPFRSAGIRDLPGVTGSLTTTNPAATIVDGSATWELLGNGRTAPNAGPLTVRLPNSCYTNVPLTVDVTSADGSVPAESTVRMRPWPIDPKAIADAPDPATDAVTVATFEGIGPGTITDVDIRIDDLRHTYLSDLVIEVSHAGQTAKLFDPTADWGGDDIVDAVFDSDSLTPQPTAGAGPVTGRMRPAELTGLNKFDGKPAAGTWTLRITDVEPGDDGVLDMWGPDGPRAQFPCSGAEIPAAATGAASDITQRGVTLAGTVTPNGRATGLRFAYGKTGAYGSATATQDVGAGAAAVAGNAAVTDLEPGTTYHFRVEAIREGGAVAVAGADGTFTTAPAPPVPLPTVSPAPTAAPDRTAPSFTGKPKVKLAKAGKKNKRATFTFALSEPATVTAVVTRATPGIKKGSKCVPVPKKKPAKAKACTRQVKAATGSAKPGAKTLALPAKGLGKGKYTATLTATDAAGNKTTAQVSFTIR
jgi:Fungalysin metallopeptidase (M36)/Proprotein convertase P-domain/Fungalysin/Thermolysin Propeptide Motif